jgi:DNA polymerase
LGKSVTVPQSLFVESAEVPETPEGRRQALTLLGEEVARCQKCAELAATRTQTVLGVGPIDVELCLIGEAPGADEDRLGEPFVGQAGQMLNRILDACGLKREEVYICNILKCRPPGNRTPKAEECNNCREFLERQLRLVRPKFIVALGAVAAQNLLNDKSSITRLRGRFHEYNGIPVLCTYHPAALLPNRSPEKKREVWADMKMLLARMGRPIPRGGSQSG